MGGVGRWIRETVGDSAGSGEVTSGFSFTGFLGGGGLANFDFCTTAAGLSGSAYKCKRKLMQWEGVTLRLLFKGY